MLGTPWPGQPGSYLTTRCSWVCQHMAQCHAKPCIWHALGKTARSWWPGTQGWWECFHTATFPAVCTHPHIRATLCPIWPCPGVASVRWHEGCPDEFLHMYLRTCGQMHTWFPDLKGSQMHHNHWPRRGLFDSCFPGWNSHEWPAWIHNRCIAGTSRRWRTWPLSGCCPNPSNRDPRPSTIQLVTQWWLEDTGSSLEPSRLAAAECHGVVAGAQWQFAPSQLCWSGQNH